jgi:hypothetical protein
MDQKIISLINSLEIDELQELVIGMLNDKPELIPKLEVIVNKKSYKKTIGFYTKLVKTDLPRINRTTTSEKEFVKSLKRNTIIINDLKKNKMYEELLKVYIAMIKVISSKNDTPVVHDYGYDLAEDIAKTLELITDAKTKILYTNMFLFDYNLNLYETVTFNLVFQMILADKTNDDIILNEIYTHVCNYKTKFTSSLFPLKYTLLSKLKRIEELEKMIFDNDNSIPPELQVKFLYEIKQDHDLLLTFIEDNRYNIFNYSKIFEILKSMYQKTEDQKVKDRISFILFKHLKHSLKSYSMYESNHNLLLKDFYYKHKDIKLEEFFMDFLANEKYEYYRLNAYQSISEIDIQPLIPNLLIDNQISFYIKLKLFLQFSLEDYSEFYPTVVTELEGKMTSGKITSTDYDIFTLFLARLYRQDSTLGKTIISDLKLKFPGKKALFARFSTFLK